MKRLLKWFVVPTALLLIILVVVANLLAEPASTLPAPDGATPITLADGRVESLERVLERAADRARVLAADVPETASEEVADPQQPTQGSMEQVRTVLIRSNQEPSPDETDLFTLGRYAMRKGRVEEALALLQSVPEQHERYDTAQRYIGWELLTKELDKPGLGLAYMNRALDAAPLEGENWQDASRVYLRTLGVRWDPVNNRMR